MTPKISGFSLIEMAIVLIIIGVMGGFTLPALKLMLDWQKGMTTAEHQEKILYALASYAVQHNILPYAADPNNPSGIQEKTRRRGIVPYADLGLPEAIAKDGYHRWFTYVVDDYYAVLPQWSAPQQRPSRLCEKIKHLNPLTIKGVPENVALALISHGSEGRGAYPLVSLPQGQDEAQNATSDKEIIDRPISQNPSNPFSHKVVWVTAKNLLALYGHAPCPPVEEVRLPANQFNPPQDPEKKKIH